MILVLGLWAVPTNAQQRLQREVLWGKGGETFRELRCDSTPLVLPPPDEPQPAKEFCKDRLCTPADQAYSFTIIPGEGCWTGWISAAPGWEGVAVMYVPSSLSPYPEDRGAWRDGQYEVVMSDRAWAVPDDLAPYVELFRHSESTVMRWWGKGPLFPLTNTQYYDRVRFRIDVPPSRMWGNTQAAKIYPLRLRVVAVSPVKMRELPMPFDEKATIFMFCVVGAAIGAYVFRKPLAPIAWRLADLLAPLLALFTVKSSQSPRPVKATVLASRDTPRNTLPSRMGSNEQREHAKKRVDEEGEELRAELMMDFPDPQSEVARRIPASGAPITAWTEFWGYLQERQVSRAQERYNEVRLRVEAQALKKLENYLALRRGLAEVERLDKEKKAKDLELDVQIEERKQRLRELRGRRSKKTTTKFDSYYEILNRYRQEAPSDRTRAQFAAAMSDTLRARCFEEIKQHYGEQLRTDPDLRKKREKDGFKLD